MWVLWPGRVSILSNSSLSKNKAFYSPMSDCIYFYAYKKVGKKATRYTRCTNRITTCPLCNLYIWWYNLVPHYLNVHPAEDTDNISIPKEEIELLKKSKKWYCACYQSSLFLNSIALFFHAFYLWNELKLHSLWSETFPQGLFL